MLPHHWRPLVDPFAASAAAVAHAEFLKALHDIRHTIVRTERGGQFQLERRVGPNAPRFHNVVAVRLEGLEAGELGAEARIPLVFHGGSGSSLEEIQEAVDYGVVKMNVDTDLQYAFTRPIVDHVFKNYQGVLMVDGDVGNKKVYDPRSYLKLAEAGMAERVKQSVSDLRGEGKTLFEGD